MALLTCTYSPLLVIRAAVAAASFDTPDAAQQLACPVVGQPLLGGNETSVREILDFVELGLGDQGVVIFDSYLLVRSLKVEVHPTPARCLVV